MKTGATQSSAKGAVDHDPRQAPPPAGAGDRDRCAAVHAALQAALDTVLTDTGRTPLPVTGGMLLANDVGLDSLDLAQTIVLLERSLGVDPFRHGTVSRPTIRTVDDLVRIYTAAAAVPSSASPAVSPQDPSPE